MNRRTFLRALAMGGALVYLAAQAAGWPIALGLYGIKLVVEYAIREGAKA